MKTTKKHFELFQSISHKYVKALGLTDWSIHYAHEQLDDLYAETRTNVGSRVATIALGTYWDDLRPLTDTELKKLALHETLHVLLAPLMKEATERYTTPYGLEQFEHDVIRRLENIVGESE